MKNAAATIIIAVLVLGNGAIAALRADTAGQIDAGQSQIAALTSEISVVQSETDAVKAQNSQASATLLSLQAVIAQSGSGTAVQAEINSAVTAIKSAVVKLNVTGAGLRGYGSGVIVNAAGYVLTVLHAVDGAGSITVTLSTGEQFQAVVSQTNSDANLALLKMTTTRTDFPVATIGSMNGLAVGQNVVASGYPLSPELAGPVTFTHGIVSALRTAADFYFVQSDANIAPGSGGGGLFTLDGKMVGISSLYQADGIYLFIPVDAAASLLSGAKTG